MVVEVLLDDDVEHRHAQGRVGAGTQAQVPVGTRGDPVDARVDAHELGAAAHHVDGGVTEQAVAVGRKGLLAPEHDELGKLEHRVVIATGQTAGVVHLGIGRAHDVGRARDTRNVAGIAGLRIARVGGTQACVRVCGKHGATLATGTAHDQDGFGTILVLEVLYLLGDGVIRLVPRDTLPLVLAAVLASALHGIQDAIGIVDVIADGQATDAEAAVCDGMVLIALDAHELVVGVHIGLDTASGRMTSRRRPCATTGDGEAVFFEAPRLAKIGSALTFENLHALSFPLLSQPVLSLRVPSRLSPTGGTPASERTRRDISTKTAGPARRVRPVPRELRERRGHQVPRELRVRRGLRGHRGLRHPRNLRERNRGCHLRTQSLRV